MQDRGNRLAHGDASAFAELYDACADRLHHYLTMRLGSRDAASDVLQEVFLRLVRTRKRLHRVDNPAAYAFAIARNESTRWLSRRRRYATEITLDAAELFLVDKSQSFASRERAEAVTDAMNHLDERDREIIELKVYGGLTFREVSHVTKTSEATVATRYRRAVQRMHRRLVRELR